MKKILSLLVSAMLLLSIVPAVTLTANAEAGMSWQDKEGLLEALEILPEKKSTEEEIDAGFLQGVIAGMYHVGAETAAAEESETVSYTQAAEKILEVLGYSYYLGNDNYLRQVTNGNSMGLFDGMNVSDFGAALNYGDLVQMVYNALSVSVMEMSLDGNGKPTYEIKKDSTILTKYFDAEEVEGILTADGKTSLYSADTVTGFSVDGVTYYSQETYGVKVGMRVKAYVSGGDLLYLYESSKNETVTFSGEDVYSKSRTEFEVSPEDARSKTYRFDPAASYLYNGVYLGSISSNVIPIEYFCDENMTYTLIDNDSDGRYEAVYGNKYTYIKISGKSAENQEIYDEWDDGIYEIIDGDRFYYADGIETEFNNVKKGDIVAMQIPQGLSMENRSQTIDYVILTDRISGRVTGITQDGFSVDGEEYKLNERFDIPSDVMMGKSGAFILDMTGKIIDYSETATEDENATKTEYAYIKSFYESEEDDSICVKIFKGNGMEKMSLKDKCKLTKGDTVVYENANAIFINQTDCMGKLVKVKHQGNEIKKIEIPKAIAMGEKGKDTYEFNYIPLTTGMRSRGDLIQDMYLMDSNSTEVFLIPTGGEDKDFKKVSTSKWARSSSGFSAELYAVDDEYGIGAVLARVATSSADKDIHAMNALFVIEKVVTTVNQDDEICVELTGMENNQKKTISFEDSDAESTTIDPTVETDSAYRVRSVKANDLVPGDIIQYTTKENGTVDGFRVFYRADDPDCFFTLSGNQKDAYITSSVNSNWVLVGDKDLIACIGTIGEKTKTYLKLDQTFASGSKASKNFVSSKFGNIYKVNTSSHKVEAVRITDPDIKKGERAVVTVSWGGERDLVVYY